MLMPSCIKRCSSRSSLRNKEVLLTNRLSSAKVANSSAGSWGWVGCHLRVNCIVKPLQKLVSILIKLLNIKGLLCRVDSHDKYPFLGYLIGLQLVLGYR